MKIDEQAMAAKRASFRLANVSGDIKNAALKRIADLIDSGRKALLLENKADLVEAEESGLKQSLKKRLVLNDRKVDSIIRSLHEVAALPDPLGKAAEQRLLDDGLLLSKVVVPIGVIGVIFESRPDALVQISSLCIKSGNAAILKGGKEARRTNRQLFDFILKALSETDPVFDGALHLVESREDVKELLALDEFIDLMVPRGSSELVRFIKDNTKIPVLGHTDGVCHIYVDREADIDMALEVSYDAKCQYPAVCNAVESLLVHADIAEDFLPKLAKRLEEVELRGDERVRKYIEAKPATPEDWLSEYNDLILSVKVVDSQEEAIDHINTFGSHHTDAVITTNEETAARFMQLVDSSSVLRNCSTRFADGFRYGFGAELGISTNKIHARGPVGLEGLCLYKYTVSGQGQVVADYVEGRKSFKHQDLS